MDRDTFITTVSRMLAVEPDTAGRAIRVTLSTLGERIGADEGWRLVSALPPDLGPLLYAAGPGASFDAEAFVHRVAERAQVDPRTAAVHVAAVLAVLAQAIDEPDYRHLVGILSPDYAPLLPR